jgi:hypothetical protein
MAGEKINIPAGQAINEGDHEDGDDLYSTEDLEAEVVGIVPETGSLKVIIPKVDPELQFFVHQPPKKEKT